MPAPNSFRDVIELWATREACASDVGAKGSQVSKWWQRDKIPSEWWIAVLATSVAQASGLTAATFAALDARIADEPANRLAEART
jgi:hypothetical protein